MNSIAKRLIALILFLIAGSVYADSLVSKIEGLVSSAPTVRGKFIQSKTLSGVSKKLNSEGFFIVDKSKGIVWITEKPIYQTLKVSDSGIRIENKSGVLMNLDARSEPSVKYINELVLAIFSGDMSALERLFNYSGDVTAKGWNLELTPKNTTSTFFKKITIVGGSAINRISFISKDGDLTEVIFSDVRLAPVLNKDETLQFQ
ncbi:outer membrane lipoprotein carrier protein LolA [Polynucleobacter paneuropaeus]|nr:outer membrane lipoprotein carrier protein LolA [Polynucleobacter paneuropaeus]